MREGIWAHIGVEESTIPVSIASPLEDFRFIFAVFALIIGMTLISAILYVMNTKNGASSSRGRDSGRRRHLLIASVLAASLSIIMVIVSQLIPYTPVRASQQAQAIDSLFALQFGIAAVIFSIVLVFILYSVVVFRQRPGDTGDGPPVHGNPGLETVWTVIPLAIVIFLGVYSVGVLSDIKKPLEAVEPLEVKVTALRFAWIFEYPEHGITSTELRLPINRPVLLKLTSRDVVHSFWVPEFRLKQDAVPGLETLLRVTPSRIGEYNILCAELCGIGHTTMVSKVVVVEEEAFQRWVAEKKGG